MIHIFLESIPYDSLIYAKKSKILGALFKKIEFFHFEQFFTIAHHGN